MKIKNLIGVRQFSIASAAALAVSLAGAGGAAASPWYGSTSGGHAAAVASASVTNGTLTITGTEGRDNIAIALASVDPNILTVDLNNDGTTDQHFDRATFSAIAVLLEGGDDKFATVGTPPDEPMTVDAGRGDDTVTTGSGNDVIIGGSGDDVVVGGIGHDTAFLGSGSDSFVWNPGDGSDFVEGDSGFDTMVFNGAGGPEQMSLSANGPQSVFLRSPGNVRMDMDGVEQLNLAALGGSDTVAINDLTGTDLVRANVDLGAGDGAIDNVTVNGTDHADRVRVRTHHGRVDVEGLSAETRITGSEPTDHLQVNTLGGRDRVNADSGVSSLIGFDADLGTV